jgi:multicomponent Na+:H+ antiporter subunit C
MEFTQANLYTLCSIFMFAIGLLGFLLNTDFIRKLLGLNVIGIAIFMLLLATAYNYPNAIDPIPHAMVLTGIIVAAAGTALGLNLASKIAKFARLVQKEEAATLSESLIEKSKNDIQGRG